MTWLKLDDQMADHPKFLVLGDDYETGLAVYIAGLCYCGKHLTDGLIPRVRAHTLTPSAERMAPRLVEVGVWHDEGAAYRVHDFLEYNPTKEKVLANRKATRLRVAGWRNKGSNGVTDGEETA